MRGRQAISAVLLAAALLLPACGGVQPNPDEAAWWDGCQAGRARADNALSPDEPKDDERYASQAEYRQAWDDGFSLCFSRRSLQTVGR
ncbi:MAG TPA: hypothetical protein VEJ16_01930 [Alphaproteobacteria bacterium]|nr:hypothetical protein [Alphaproteobacteria bacterium]